MDTEATGTDFFHGCKPYVVTACDGKTNMLWKGRVDPQTREVYWDTDELIDLQKYINDCKELVFQSLNFDRRALETIGIYLPQPLIHDTLVSGHCVNNLTRKLGHPLGLKEQAITYYGYFNDDEIELHKSIESIRGQLSRNNPDKIQYAKVGHPHFPGSTSAAWEQDMWLDMPRCIKYALRDPERTLLLHKAFVAYLIQHNLYNQYLFRLRMLPVLYRMQTVGINVYENKIDELVKELDIQIEQLVSLIRSSSKCPYTIDPAKTKDLSFILYNILKLDVINSTDTGLPSTDENTLTLLEEEYDDVDTIRYIKAWRKATKVRTDISSYKTWCKDGRLHSTVMLTGTIWTRQSSNDPNQQNFNKKLEYLFGPPPGYYWLYADVVNIELRIWAYDVGAKTLIEAFERGDSVHMIIAMALPPFAALIEKIGVAAFKQTKSYTKCKNGTFARIYGGSDKKVNDTYGVAGACAIIDKHLPEVGQYFKQLEAIRATNADLAEYPCIYTHQGYRLFVPLNKPYTVPSARIQGCASLIVQDMMIRIVRDPVYIKQMCELNQQVHDSIKIEIRCHAHSEDTNTHLINHMEQTGRLHIPTCPMDYQVIEYHGDEPQLFRDYTFIPRKIEGYEIEMYMHNHQYFCSAVYDKDTVLHEYGPTKEIAYNKVIAKIEAEEILL